MNLEEVAQLIADLISLLIVLVFLSAILAGPLAILAGSTYLAHLFLQWAIS